jgi:GTP-binding protein Era
MLSSPRSTIARRKVPLGTRRNTTPTRSLSSASPRSSGRKIFLHTRDELPHAVYVSYEDSSRGENDSLLASYDLVVERESQKGILIGKGGSMIKRIREEAESDLADIFDYAIRLKLSVRVDPDWKKNDKKLEQLIF